MVHADEQLCVCMRSDFLELQLPGHLPAATFGSFEPQVSPVAGSHVAFCPQSKVAADPDLQSMHAYRPEGMANARVLQNGNRSHSCIALRDIAAGEEVGLGRQTLLYVCVGEDDAACCCQMLYAIPA